MKVRIIQRPTGTYMAQFLYKDGEWIAFTVPISLSECRNEVKKFRERHTISKPKVIEEYEF